MRTVLRGVLGVFAGVVVAAVVILAIEVAGHHLFPLGAGVDVSNHEAIAEAMATGKVPAGALAALLVAWAAGTAVGAWVAAKVARRGKLGHGLAVGVLFLAAAVANMLMIPHPVWVWVVGVAEFLPAAYLGARLASPRPGSGKPESVAGLA